jgi:hypothetical protein
MYGIDVPENLDEQELSHLEGHRARRQYGSAMGRRPSCSFDINGELMDSVYLCNKYWRPLYHDGWMELSRNLEWLIDHWASPTKGSGSRALASSVNRA